jgi:hypothetical protein
MKPVLKDDFRNHTRPLAAAAMGNDHTGIADVTIAQRSDEPHERSPKQEKAGQMSGTHPQR